MVIPLAVPALFFLEDIVSTFSDISFVVTILVFCYLLYWLFITFNRVPILFGASALVAAYFLFVQPLPTIFLVVIFFLFIVAGSQLQFAVQFGLQPILHGLFGVDITGGEYMAREQQALQLSGLNQKLASGAPLTEQEMEMAQHMSESAQVEPSGPNINMMRRPR